MGYARFIQHVLYLGGRVSATRGISAVRRNPLPQTRGGQTQNERALSVLDDVGFTEEKSQAWLRNFRLLHHKNGKSAAPSLLFI